MRVLICLYSFGEKCEYAFVKIITLNKIYVISMSVVHEILLKIIFCKSISSDIVTWFFTSSFTRFLVYGTYFLPLLKGFRLDT